MAAAHADDITAAIKRAVNLVDVVQEHVALTRRGRVFKGLCPFHDDHNPSLTVDPEKQYYKCWSCGAAGDVFTFVMSRERIDFREALTQLAERARIQLPALRTRTHGSKNGFFDLMRWAEEEFVRCFHQSELAQPARDYVKKRGIDEGSVQKFRIGYAPNEWEWLVSLARAKRFTPEQLERAGLARRRQRGAGVYDLFRGRLMFPIRDTRGRTIAFGGRILPEFDTPEQGKYVNSPETPIFTKGEHLYGLDVARDAIAKAKSVVVVEGYTDCIMAHQHGLTHVVGTLGTALGTGHISVLKRYADRVVLVYDGDRAGQDAADRALGLILSQEIDLHVLTLPDNLDPCDYLLAGRAEEFERGIDSAPDALDFKLRRAGERFDLSSLAGRRQALDFVLTAIAALPVLTTGSAPVTREIILDRLGQRLGLPAETVRRRLRELRDQRARGRERDDETQDGASTLWHNDSKVDFEHERELMEIVLTDPSRIGTVAEQIDFEVITTPGFRRMLEVCIEIDRAGEVLDLDSLRLRLEDRELACRASILAETGREKGALDRRLADVLAYFRERTQPTQQEPATGADDAQKRFLAERYQQALTRQRKATRHAKV